MSERVYPDAWVGSAKEVCSDYLRLAPGTRLYRNAVEVPPEYTYCVRVGGIDPDMIAWRVPGSIYSSRTGLQGTVKEVMLRVNTQTQHPEHSPAWWAERRRAIMDSSTRTAAAEMGTKKQQTLAAAALQRCIQCQQMPPKDGSRFCSHACSRAHSRAQHALEDENVIRREPGDPPIEIETGWIRHDGPEGPEPVHPLPVHHGRSREIGPSAVASVKGVRPRRSDIVIRCQGDFED